jgi:hypothetical protein
VCTVNTIYFWRSLDAGFAEIRRVLAPGGCVVVGFLPKEWMDRLGHSMDIFTSRTADDVIAALTASGFTRGARRATGADDALERHRRDTLTNQMPMHAESGTFQPRPPPAAMPSHASDRTLRKRRWRAPSSLRSPAAAQRER